MAQTLKAFVLICYDIGVNTMTHSLQSLLATRQEAGDTDIALSDTIHFQFPYLSQAKRRQSNLTTSVMHTAS